MENIDEDEDAAFHAAVLADWRNEPIIGCPVIADQFKVLEVNSAAFQEIVLEHVKALPSDEWARLRHMATDESRYSCDLDTAMPHASREELVIGAISHDGISVDELSTPKFKARAEEIGSIAGAPVFYIAGEGMYFWGADRTSRATLNLWLTHPAYPPGW